MYQISDGVRASENPVSASSGKCFQRVQLIFPTGSKEMCFTYCKSITFLHFNYTNYWEVGGIDWHANNAWHVILPIANHIKFYINSLYQLSQLSLDRSIDRDRVGWESAQDKIQHRPFKALWNYSLALFLGICWMARHSKFVKIDTSGRLSVKCSSKCQQLVSKVLAPFVYILLRGCDRFNGYNVIYMLRNTTPQLN